MRPRGWPRARAKILAYCAGYCTLFSSSESWMRRRRPAQQGGAGRGRTPQLTHSWQQRKARCGGPRRGRRCAVCCGGWQGSGRGTGDEQAAVGRAAAVGTGQAASATRVPGTHAIARFSTQETCGPIKVKRVLLLIRKVKPTAWPTRGNTRSGRRSRRGGATGRTGQRGSG